MEINPLLLTIGFLLLAMGLGLSIAAYSKQQGTGQQGPPGTNNPSQILNMITPIRVNNGDGDVNLLTTLSPTSSIILPANSVSIGSIIRLLVSYDVNVDTGLTLDTTLTWGLSNATTLGTTTISTPESGSQRAYTVQIDLTFNTLTTVNSNIVTPFQSTPFVANIPFDSTIENTFTLVGSVNNDFYVDVNQVTITKLS